MSENLMQSQEKLHHLQMYFKGELKLISKATQIYNTFLKSRTIRLLSIFNMVS